MYILAKTDGYNISVRKFTDLYAAKSVMCAEYEEARKTLPCNEPLEDYISDVKAVYADGDNYLVWEIHEVDAEDITSENIIRECSNNPVKCVNCPNCIYDITENGECCHARCSLVTPPKMGKVITWAMTTYQKTANGMTLITDCKTGVLETLENKKRAPKWCPRLVSLEKFGN